MIIGFTGKKGAGKNHAAYFIQQEIEGALVTAFADPLREVCSTIFGLSARDMTDRDAKETKLERYPFESPRQIMQKVGTDCVRAIYPDAWVESLKHRVKGHSTVLVPDVRFENEVAAIRELGGKVVRIIRPSADHTDPHPSETLMDSLEVDMDVLNDGCLNLFKHRVLAAYWELRQR